MDSASKAVNPETSHKTDQSELPETHATNASSQIESTSDSTKLESGNEKKANLESTNDRTSRNWKRPISNIRWYFVVVGILVTVFLYGIDSTIAGDVQGPIVQSLGEIEKLSWVGLGFPLGSLAVILLSGKCNTLFDIKYLFILGVLTFEIGSAICGAAPNMNAMICGRIIAGIGGAGVYISSLTYIAVFTNHREAALYTAMIGLCWGTGAIVGPLIGGGFSSSSATWRWAFYINLPLAAACGPIYLFVFPNFNPRPNLTFLQKFFEIDWIGATLNAMVFSIFQIVLTVAGSTFAWKSAEPIILWIVFGLSAIGFAIQQQFCLFTTRENRLFPVQFLASRSLILLYFGAASAATGVYIPVYYITLYFQFTRGDSAIHAAVRLLPYIVVMVVMVMISGGTLAKVGRYQIYYLIGGAFLLTGASLMHTVTSATSTSKIYGYEALLGIGAGLMLQVAYSVAAVKVTPPEVPSAIGYINVAQIGSNSLCLAIAGCIFQNVGFRELKNVLSQYNFSDRDIRDALAGTAANILNSQGEEVRRLAVDAIVDTIAKVWIMGIAAGALAFVSAVLMRREKLLLEVPEEKETEEIVPVEGPLAA